MVSPQVKTAALLAVAGTIGSPNLQSQTVGKILKLGGKLPNNLQLAAYDNVRTPAKRCRLAAPLSVQILWQRRFSPENEPRPYRRTTSALTN